MFIFFTLLVKIICRSLLQETFVVYDCFVSDDGITDPKPSGSWVKSTDGTITISSTGTTFKSSSNATYRNTTPISGDFEAVLQASLTSTIRIGVQTSSQYNYAQSKFNYFDVSDYYFKLRRVNGVFTAQMSSDGVTWTNRSLETDNVGTHDCYFLLQIISSGNERSITYKDLRIYPI